MIAPIKVLKLKEQNGRVYVPSLGIEITVIDTDTKGLYIVGKDDNGKTICADSAECELIKNDNEINNDVTTEEKKEKVNIKTNITTNTNTKTNTYVDSKNKEKAKTKNKKSGSFFSKKKTK